MHAPAFASFDGVSGGMILDLSEEGLSMQTDTRLDRDRRVRLEVDLSELFGMLPLPARAPAIGQAFAIG